MLDFVDAAHIVPLSDMLDFRHLKDHPWRYDLEPFNRLSAKTELKRISEWDVEAGERKSAFKFYVALELKEEKPEFEEKSLVDLKKLSEDRDPEASYLYAEAIAFKSSRIKEKASVLYQSLKEAFEGGIEEAFLPFGECLLYSIGNLGKEKEGLTLLSRHPIGASEREIGLYYLRNHDEKAKSYLLKGYRKGDRFCAFPLGLLFFYGLGERKNKEKALVCFQYAAKDQDERALYYLGVMNEKGIGCEKDVERAKSYFLQDGQNPRSLRHVADIVLAGEGKEKVQEAAKLYQQSADMGSEIAALKLKGLVYLLGKDVRFFNGPLQLSYYQRRKIEPALQKIASANDPKKDLFPYFEREGRNQRITVRNTRV